MNSRFRQITPGSDAPSGDEISIDLEHFEAELAATIANFDAKHVAIPGTAAKDVGTPPPLIRQQELVQKPIAPPPAQPRAAPPQPAAATGGLDLLSELRQVAQQKSETESSLEAEKKARAEQTELAMRKLFRYLAELCAHLNKIQPPLPHQYRSPIPNVSLSDLKWRDSFIDFRTNGGTETSPLDSISLRYTLSTGKSIRVEKLPNHAGAYQEELKRYGQTFQAIERRGTRGLVEQIEFNFDPAVNVSISFKANPDAALIQVRTRHLTDYPDPNYKDYTLEVSQVSQSMMDEFGKQLLGRASLLFQYLTKS